VKEVELLDVDGNVKAMNFTQYNNPCPITSCGRRRIERVSDIYTKRKSRKANNFKLKINEKKEKRA